MDATPEDVEADLILRGARQMFRSWRAFKDCRLTREELQAAVSGFRGCLHRWATKAAQPDEQGRRRGLAKHLKRVWPGVFQFIDRDGIEPTNNQAERDLRPAVLWRRGTFGTRSEAGSRFASRVLPVWATSKKRGVALIDWLTDAVQAAAGLRGTPTFLQAWPCPQSPGAERLPRLNAASGLLFCGAGADAASGPGTPATSWRESCRCRPLPEARHHADRPIDDRPPVSRWAAPDSDPGVVVAEGGG